MSFTVAPIVAFLTRPLLAAAFPPASIAAAHLILAAALAPTPAGTLTLTARTPPPALAAACLGAKIAWPVWFAAFAGRKLTKSGGAIIVTYTPQRAEARLQPALLKPQHKRTRAVSFAAPAADASARLRAVLLSARQRVAAPASRAAVRRPSPLRVCSYSSDEDSDLDSVSDSDSECGSSFDSDDCASSVSSAPTTPPASPTKPTASVKAAPWVPAWRLRAAAAAATARPSASTSKPKPTTARSTAPAKATPRAVAYHYTGGVTRVVAGGVMLGPSRA